MYYKMNKIIILVLVLIGGVFLFFNFNQKKDYILKQNFNLLKSNTQKTYEELYKKYIPQNTPDKTYLLELDLLSKGMYCYDLPLFDLKWRQKGKKIFYSNSYKNTAEKFSIPYKIYIENDYAVIYFPNDKNKGPDFLYKDSSVWILDRTAVWNNIHYNYSNTGWFAYDNDYPYLKLLKKVFHLQKIKLDNGVWAYAIAEN